MDFLWITLSLDWSAQMRWDKNHGKVVKNICYHNLWTSIFNIFGLIGAFLFVSLFVFLIHALVSCYSYQHLSQLVSAVFWYLFCWPSNVFGASLWPYFASVAFPLLPETFHASLSTTNITQRNKEFTLKIFAWLFRFIASDILLEWHFDVLFLTVSCPHIGLHSYSR